MRSEREWVGWFEGLLDQQEGRRDSRDAALPAARAVAGRISLVHRTAKRPVGGAATEDGAEAGRGWRRAFDEGRLAAGPVGTAWELDAGVRRAVYLFLGAPAYPKGKVALLFDGAAEVHACAPFDTGALAGGHISGGGGRSGVDAGALFGAAYGEGRALAELSAHWMAAHFDDPLDYVRAGQQQEPQRPALHGLRGEDGDRRAWTVEVQVHGDLPLEPSLRRVVLDYGASCWRVVRTRGSCPIDGPPSPRPRPTRRSWTRRNSTVGSRVRY